MSKLIRELEVISNDSIMTSYENISIPMQQEVPNQKDQADSNKDLFWDSFVDFLKNLFERIRHVLIMLLQFFADIFSAICNILTEKTVPSAIKTLIQPTTIAKNRKNYASKDSGATILWKSDGIKNPKAILSANKEEYLILP